MVVPVKEDGTSADAQEYNEENDDVITQDGFYDNIKNQLTLYKSSSIHSRKVTNILRSRSPESLGEKFKFHQGQVQLNIGEFTQKLIKEEDNKKISGDKFLSLKQAFIP